MGSVKRVSLYLLLLFIGQIVWSQQSTAPSDTIISYNYTSPTDSVFDSRAVSSYDSYGKLTLELYYLWDQDLSYWEEAAKCEYAYNSGGYLIQDFLYHWDSSLSIWIEYSKREYEYDSDGNMLLEEFFKWDTGLSEWLESYKSEYTYDTHGNQTVNSGYDWDPDLNEWKAISKFEVSYDEGGYGTLSIFYTWKSSLNSWVGFFKNEDAYDSHGNKISRIVSFWNSNASDWMLTDKLEYTYDNTGNRVLETYYSWDSSQNDWMLSYIREMAYDSRGNNTLSSSHIWDKGKNDWILIYKSFYYYDSRYYTESASICGGDNILWQGDYYDTEGTYYASYIAETGSDSIHVLKLTVNANPPSFSISGYNIVQENQLVLYSAPANPYVVYNWSADNGNVIANPSDNSVEIIWGGEGGGAIYGIAVDQNACMSDTSSLLVIIGSPDNDNLLNTEILIYPNPAIERFYIDTRDNTQMEVFRVEIINQLGNRLHEALVQSPVYELNFSSWAVPGLYFVQFLDLYGDVIDTQKIILQ